MIKIFKQDHTKTTLIKKKKKPFLHTVPQLPEVLPQQIPKSSQEDSRSDCPWVKCPNHTLGDSAQSLSVSNTSSQNIGLFTDSGKKCGNVEPKGTFGEEAWEVEEGMVRSGARGDKVLWGGSDRVPKLGETSPLNLAHRLPEAKHSCHFSLVKPLPAHTHPSINLSSSLSGLQWEMRNYRMGNRKKTRASY